MNPHFLDLGISWSLMLLPLYPRGKSRWYPLDRRLGGPAMDDVKKKNS
jgi:hypothetical protein